MDFWRFIRHDSPDASDFAPDCDVRDRFPTEDHCSYRGFSAWTQEKIARDTARDVLNPRLIDAREPPFTHVVHFRTWLKGRHTCARLGPEPDHWGIWAPAEDFVGISRIVDVFSIQERREYDD